MKLRGEIESILKEAGAIACGVATALPVASEAAEARQRWINEGNIAGMDYLASYDEIRRDPRLLLEGAQSVISSAFSFHPSRTRDIRGHIAAYALGDDYHDVIRKRLRDAVAEIEEKTGIKGEWRICVDTAPIQERYWALQTRTGFLCRNGMIGVEGHGNMLFLAEIVTTAGISKLTDEEELKTEAEKEIGVGENPFQISCLDCGACLRACPAGALKADATVDARNCLSYLTIEHRGPWEDDTAKKALATPAGKNTLYGCDLCLSVCPLNRGVGATSINEFAARERLLTLTCEEITGMEQPEFSSTFKRSAIKRAKLAGLRRNAAHILTRT